MNSSQVIYIPAVTYITHFHFQGKWSFFQAQAVTEAQSKYFIYSCYAKLHEMILNMHVFKLVTHRIYST